MNKRIPRVLAVIGKKSPDLVPGRNAPVPLEHVCRLFGYKVSAYTAGNLDELVRTIKFIGAVGRLPEFEADPLVVHIGAGGAIDCLEIGRDRAAWEQLTLAISDMVRDLKAFSRPVILILSAPTASEKELMRLLPVQAGSAARPPDHMFLFVDGSPRWTDTILAWAHFYGEVVDMDFTADSLAHHPGTQGLTARLQRLGLGKLHYVRWCLS